ncbi:MAG TPA: hypothetical protein VNF24_09890 [Candidatus Acidoferrales bacterium]|nr:hypothetical protein [Candidatus Acidoferrales bacterium]
MESSNGFDLDQLLERELKQRAAAQPGGNPLPAASRYHAAFVRGGLHMPFVPQLVAGLSAKAITGLAVASVAVGGGTAATIATGSANPVNWGQAVVQAVTQCRADYGPGATPTGSSTAKDNVGQCVSSVAKQRGQQERTAHAKGKPSGLSTAHATGEPSGLPTAHATGEPSGLPTSGSTGSPTGLPTAPANGKPTGTPPAR